MQSETEAKLEAILTEQAENSPAAAASAVSRWLLDQGRRVVVGETLHVAMMIASGRGKRHPPKVTVGKIASRLMIRDGV